MEAKGRNMLDELVDEYVAVRKARDKRSKRLQELAEQIKEIVEPGSSLVLEDGTKVSITEASRIEKVDKKRLKAEHPDAYCDVVIISELAPSLRITEAKGGDVDA